MKEKGRRGYEMMSTETMVCFIKVDMNSSFAVILSLPATFTRVRERENSLIFHSLSLSNACFLSLKIALHYTLSQRVCFICSLCFSATDQVPLITSFAFPPSTFVDSLKKFSLATNSPFFDLGLDSFGAFS